MMEYTPLDEELSYETALIQAAQTLDMTAMIAVEQRDTERLLQTTETWVKLADFLVALGEAQEKKELDKKPERDFKPGFNATEKDEEQDDDE